jgi:hypothetical protein
MVAAVTAVLKTDHERDAFPAKLIGRWREVGVALFILTQARAETEAPAAEMPFWRPPCRHWHGRQKRTMRLLNFEHPHLG